MERISYPGVQVCLFKQELLRFWCSGYAVLNLTHLSFFFNSVLQALSPVAPSSCSYIELMEIESMPSSCINPGKDTQISVMPLIFKLSVADIRSICMIEEI